jgi:ATP-binding cassette subfamily C exporter for protease/lipase
MAPVEQAIGVWKQLLTARGSWERLSKLLQDFPARNDAMSLPKPQGLLAVEQAMTAAPGGVATILRGVNFNLSPGEALGIIGPSASGKSTLARLLVGVWPAQSGKVRLDGADIYQWNNSAPGSATCPRMWSCSKAPSPTTSPASAN